MEALDQCFEDFESILQRFIVWAIYREQEDGKPLRYPSAGLIQAIKEEWKLRDKNAWSDEIYRTSALKVPVQNG